MLMPSIFGENLFDDDWMDFPFDGFDREFWERRIRCTVRMQRT